MKQNSKNTTKQAKNVKARKLYKAISIGIWGAILWAFVAYVCYWLNLSKISPSHLSKLFIKNSLIFHWQGILLAFGILIFLSILFSVIYVFLFSHLYTPWIGVACGIVLSAIWINWRNLDTNSIASMVSVFTLYGVFVGYSLSMEFASLNKKQP